MSAPIPQFIDPTGGAAWPAWRELSGRFVALVPTGYKTGVPKFRGKPGETTDEADFDLYVLDGSWPLLYGALADGTRGVTHRVDGPAQFRGCSTQNVNIVRAIRKGWDGQQAIGTVLGVIALSTVGDKGNKPWNIESVENNDPRKALAAQIFGAVQAGTLQWAAPVELAPAPVQQQQAAAPSFLPQQQAAPAAMPSFLQPAAPAAPALIKPAQVTNEIWASLTPDQKQQAVDYFANPANPF